MAGVFSLLFLFVCVTIVEPLNANGQLGRALALNDFESGTTSPWNDESAADVRWAIETNDAPFEVDQPAPNPVSGRRYLRVTRPPGTSGNAVLRSDTFTASPSDQFTLSFWIRSVINWLLTFTNALLHHSHQS